MVDGISNSERGISNSTYRLTCRAFYGDGYKKQTNKKQVKNSGAKNLRGDVVVKG